ncbi:MAG: AMP-binding protein [Rudaea sp.]
MSAAIKSGLTPHSARVLPLLAHADPQRVLVWRGNQPIHTGTFLAEVHALAARLPSALYATNLCADRYRFLVAFCAVIVAGQTNLLPASRAPQAIAEVMSDYPDSYALCDSAIELPPQRLFMLPDFGALAGDAAVPDIAVDRIVAIGFTSGSTGRPAANPKSWGSFCTCTTLNAAQVCANPAASNIVATVPPQHMYGLETSVLLPLRGNAAIHAGQPFFPADIAHALAQVPEPRVLVTTPVHLRALLREIPTLPALDTIISATAPLDAQLAAMAEARYTTRVIELFGSTETCVIAHRRTARESSWQLHAGVELQPQPDGTLVEAAHFATPVRLQDIVELLPSRQFTLRGRNADLLEIAGKRASLGELTRRLLAIEGVEDGVVFQLDADHNGIRRLAALVVAQGVSEAQIRNALRQAIDPVFLPRPLRRVATLPRNATGKLPRDALLAAIGLGRR